MTRLAYVQMAVRVPQDMKAELENLASMEKAHVSELIREMLAEGLKHRAATNLDQTATNDS